MEQIENLLRETMGLDAASVGEAAIHRSVRQRMKSLGLRKLEAYREILVKSELEWSELVESVVVAETWFFRDREPFGVASRLVRDHKIPAGPNQKVRLLSVPCASGEEPYSLAMSFLDAGVPPDRFALDAVDISQRAIRQALQGVYGRNSFRGEELSFRERYFEPNEQGFALVAPVKALVRFVHGNVLSPNFLAGEPPYDFIFCRNLLIYFDRPTQRRTLERLARLLSPTGMLFTGAAELPIALDHGYVAAGIPMAFACRAAPESMRLQGRPRPGRLARPLAARMQAAEERPSTRVTRKAPARGLANRPPEGAGAMLDEARRLADGGHLKEAGALCEAHLMEHGASAQAYYLLGLVYDAGGDDRAQEFYRKALYLEPNHYETLLQLALLAQKSGDTARSRAYRSRAERSRLHTATGS